MKPNVAFDLPATSVAFAGMMMRGLYVLRRWAFSPGDEHNNENSRCRGLKTSSLSISLFIICSPLASGFSIFLRPIVCGWQLPMALQCVSGFVRRRKLLSTDGFKPTLQTGAVDGAVGRNLLIKSLPSCRVLLVLC